MKEYICNRVIDSARFVIDSGCTVREAAAHFNISKSTVHTDLTKRLYSIDLSLYHEVRIILEKNLAERHIRGGESTKNKYLN
ncbi:MAG: stage III sporulation protein D [Clostridia bacterium]|nr:stage III sporulation protein D [Clostridia bacterium]